MCNKPIFLNKDAEIAEIVLNRPDKLNALNAEVWQGIIAVSYTHLTLPTKA